MENLNAEQIKKELLIISDPKRCDSCGGEYCQNDYSDPSHIKVYCSIKMASNALALITSQEQRIKELTEENERLQAEITHLEGHREADIKAFKTLKANTVRKMQERLMRKILENTVGNDSFAYFLEGYIDQIAREMLEGANETV